MSRPRRPRRPVAPAVAALTSAAVLLLAACGSQLEPADVASAGGGAGSGGLAGDGGVGGVGGEAGTDPGAVPDGGSVPGGDGGAPAAGAGGDPGTAGGGAGAAAGGGGAASPQGTTQGSGKNSATGGAKAGSCTGLKNQTGITADSITLGNAADISGPVPGLFEASQDAVKAYVAYFNASGDLCGRKLKLKSYDSRSDSGANQTAYADACESTFAMVGSMSAFDSGGSGTAAQCGLPDIRSAAVTADRAGCKTCFGAQSTNAPEFQNAVPEFVKKNHPAAAKKAAMLYVNAGAASENGKIQAEAMTKRGMDFVYVQGIDGA